MAEYLLIRFDRADGEDAATFMACNESGEVVLPPRRGRLADAASLSGGRRAVGLLPASDVVTLDAELPARAGAKLLQAVPYALERAGRGGHRRPALRDRHARRRRTHAGRGGLAHADAGRPTTPASPQVCRCRPCMPSRR